MPRLRPLWLHLEEISRRLASARRLRVASDYDGTLARIADHPDLAALDPRVHRTLGALARAAGSRVAILTGRRIEDVRAKLPLEGVFFAGSNGFETQDESGRRETHVPATRGITPALAASLAEWCQRYEGAWLENKRATLALHYRAVKPRYQAAFRAGVRRRIATIRPPARLQHGKKVYDVLPDVDWDKASALRLWYSQGGEGLLFFFGDDTNDESVHEAVGQLGGIAVAVGRTSSRAEFGVAAPEDVKWFLEWLEREWSARRARGAPRAAPD